MSGWNLDLGAGTLGFGCGNMSMKAGGCGVDYNIIIILLL